MSQDTKIDESKLKDTQSNNNITPADTMNTANNNATTPADTMSNKTMNNAQPNTMNNNPNIPNDTESVKPSMFANIYVRILIVLSAIVIGSLVYDLFFGSNQKSSGISQINKTKYNDRFKTQVSTTTQMTASKEDSDFNFSQKKIQLKPAVINSDNLSSDRKLSRIKSAQVLKYSASDSSNLSKQYKYTDLTKTLEKGKIVKAILSSYVSSQLKGNVEAVVSEDIYSTRGNNILIPRGTRIFGEFDRVLSLQLKQVLISWNEFQFPNGYSFIIPTSSINANGSHGTDFSFKYQGHKRILSNLISAGSGMLVGWVGDYTKAKIDSFLISVSNSKLSTLQTALDQVNVATDDSKLVSAIEPLQQYTDIFYAIKALGTSITTSKEKIISYLYNAINTYKNNNSYIDLSTQNLSNEIKEEINALFGEVDDYLYKQIGDPIFINIANSFEVPSDFMEEKIILR